MVRHGERQPGDDHIGERFARNINTAPKTVGAEKDAARRSFKLLKQLSTRHPAALDKKIHPFLHKKFLHLSGQLLHVAIARKKNKGAAVGLFDEMRDPALQLFLVSWIARVGHFFYDVDLHLRVEVERAAELQRFRVIASDARSEISQVGTSDRERRAGHDGAA